MYYNSFDIVPNSFPKLLGNTFLLLLQPAAPQTPREMFLSSNLFDGINKNLLNEDTSKQGSVANIDHIQLGLQSTVGSALLQLHAFFTAYIWFSFPELHVVSLCPYYGAERLLSVTCLSTSLERKSDCIRLFEKPVSYFARALLVYGCVRSRTEKDFVTYKNISALRCVSSLCVTFVPSLFNSFGNVQNVIEVNTIESPLKLLKGTISWSELENPEYCWLCMIPVRYPSEVQLIAFTCTVGYKWVCERI